jgi:hypothetical protein
MGGYFVTTAMPHGSPQFPAISSSIEASTPEQMDGYLRELHAHKNAWVAVSVQERITIIEDLIKNVAAIAPTWVAACCRAKGIANNPDLAGEEWSMGPFTLIKNLRQLHQSLTDIVHHGHPRNPGTVTTRENGQMVVQVFPHTGYDRLFFSGVTAEVWQQPGVTDATLSQNQGVIYQDREHDGLVCLVLGAGNVSSIGPTDVLYKLFVEDRVVILKMNPVNAYLGPLIERTFQRLIKRGFLRIAYGGAQVGEYLCQHKDVDEIHITGSDKTFETIVFGAGEEGARRKAASSPLLGKPITGELGSVSPVIVVPGPWSARDLAYQAEHIATSLTTNAGFICNGTRVIVTASSWEKRDALLQQLQAVLSKVAPRSAYYPGARQRHERFVKAHPDALQIGQASEPALPWTLISGVDSTQTEDICFTTEAFCSLFAETTLDASDTVEYIERAVEFANTQIWGTLNVTLLVHPTSLKDPQIAAAIERAVANLRYGTIGVNYWAGVGFTLGVTPWGAYPGHTLTDIQSGTGVVHNTLMFSRPQKSVIRAPFRSMPTPAWFVTQGKIAGKVFPKLVEVEKDPTTGKISGVLWSAITGL